MGLLCDVSLAPIYTSVENMISTDVVGTHPYSPNGVNRDGIMYWLQYAWFYTQPHIIQFSDVGELVKKLESVDLADLSNKMSKHNEKTRYLSRETWKNCLSKIGT